MTITNGSLRRGDEPRPERPARGGVRPFRFGLQLAGASDGPSWREKVRRAEALGYSTVFVPDHLENQWSPLIAMTAAAESTTTLRVGSLVLANDYRHPVMVAREVATLDRLSEGRVELGIGAGWLRTDYESAGIRYDSPGVRIERLAEAVQIMKDLWSDGYATRAGAHYSVAGARGLPRPWTTPHPKLLIGGGGRKILTLAAREADIVGINPSFPEGRVTQASLGSTTAAAFAERVGWVREAAGDQFDDLDLQCMTTLCRIVGDRRAELRRLADASGSTPREVAQLPVALVGTVDDICETLMDRRATYGLNYWVVHAPEMEAFGAVIERLRGL